MSGTELAVVVAAVVVGSVVKAVTGMGLPLIAIPIASLFVDIQDAVVVIAFPNVLANALLAGGARRSWPETRDLPTLAACGVVGAVVGTVLLVNVSDEPLVLALVAAILFYVATFLVAPERRTTPATSKRWSPVVGTVAGVFQGAIGISGPIVGSWIHSYRLPRDAHILSVTTLFLVTGFTQLVVLVASGELEGRVGATLLATVPVLASIPVGARLRDRISVRGFDLAVVALLLVSAVSLVVRTLT